MDNINSAKIVVTGAIAWVSAKMGILYPILITLVAMAITDYLTGCSASVIDGKKLSSKEGLKGILKKLGYFVAVAVGVCIDWLIVTVSAQIGIDIPVKALFGILISVWLILNELLSIVENLNRMDIRLPSFLKKTITLLIGKVEQQGDITGTENETKEKAEV